ncbi:MAG: hypothetical protein NZ874_03680, partial [Fimbriimonadales bacterium]|nr:hypothetical protein [Fimbriimonadales bacterium]
IDGGGITFASGGRYQVGGTVGQPDAHDLQPAGRYTQSGGFWFPCAIASNGDADASGCVNDQDLLIVLLNFGQTGVLIADINCDGIVNDQDLLIVLLNFGQGC